MDSKRGCSLCRGKRVVLIGVPQGACCKRVHRFVREYRCNEDNEHPGCHSCSSKHPQVQRHSNTGWNVSDHPAGISSGSLWQEPSAVAIVIVMSDKRSEMVRIMCEGIACAKAFGEDVVCSERTGQVMEQAPVTILVFNPEGLRPWLAHSIDQLISDVVDTQSIGAAIQNMLLAAQDLGLGSLRICDVSYAYEGLSKWLGEMGAMIAAVSLGMQMNVQGQGHASQSAKLCESCGGFASIILPRPSMFNASIPIGTEGLCV